MSSHGQAGRGKRNVRAVWPSFLVWSRLNLYTTPHQASPTFFVAFDQIFCASAFNSYRTMPGILDSDVFGPPCLLLCSYCYDLQRCFWQFFDNTILGGNIRGRDSQYCAPTTSSVRISMFEFDNFVASQSFNIYIYYIIYIYIYIIIY